MHRARCSALGAGRGTGARLPRVHGAVRGGPSEGSQGERFRLAESDEAAGRVPSGLPLGGGRGGFRHALQLVPGGSVHHVQLRSQTAGHHGGPLSCLPQGARSVSSFSKFPLRTAFLQEPDWSTLCGRSSGPARSASPLEPSSAAGPCRPASSWTTSASVGPRYALLRWLSTRSARELP